LFQCNIEYFCYVLYCNCIFLTSYTEGI